MNKRTALDDWCDMKGPKCPLPSESISKLRSMECHEDRMARRQRMIDHGDVDPDYFNR